MNTSNKTFLGITGAAILAMLAVFALFLTGCGSMMVAMAVQDSRAPTHEDLQNEAVDRCNDRMPGVPEHCQPGDTACQAQVHRFNMCVEEEIRNLSPASSQ